MTYGDIVKNLIARGEDDRLVFIANWDEVAISKALVALLNAAGGDILVGIGEAGAVTGVGNQQSTERELSLRLGGRMVPEAPFSLNRLIYTKVNIIHISVWEGSKKPYSYEGKIYALRSGAVVLASANDLGALIQDRKEADFHWERQAVLGAELNDLDEKEIAKTMKAYSSNKLNPDMTLSMEEFLVKFGLLRNGNFSNAAMILFGKHPSTFLPQCRLRLTAFAGNRSGLDTLYDQQLDGHLFENFERAMQFLEVTLGKKTRVQGVIRDEYPNYPRLAIREGLLNALVHRNYSSVSGSIHISLFDDRLEILSYGSLPDDLKIEDLRREHPSILRNPDIAQICYIKGYIEMLGAGTLRMIDDCRRGGFEEPIWDIVGNTLRLIYPGVGVVEKKVQSVNEGISDGLNEDISDGLSEGISDGISDGLNDGLNEGINEGISDGLSEGISDGLNEGIRQRIETKVTQLVADQVIDVFGKIMLNPGIKAKELEALTQRSIATIERYLRLLRELGMVEIRGARKVGGYFAVLVARPRKARKVRQRKSKA